MDNILCRHKTTRIRQLIVVIVHKTLAVTPPRPVGVAVVVIREAHEEEEERTDTKQPEVDKRKALEKGLNFLQTQRPPGKKGNLKCPRRCLDIHNSRHFKFLKYLLIFYYLFASRFLLGCLILIAVLCVLAWLD